MASRFISAGLAVAVGVSAVGAGALRAHASALICEAHGECSDDASSFGHTSANPSLGETIRSNPASIPIQESFGIETIDYRNSFDFALTRGLGRVGAALSPSNNDGTFFGPPGLETPASFLARSQSASKYQSGKYMIGTAANVYNNHRSGFSHFEFNLGGMLRYNSTTNSLTPGVGFSGLLGFVTFGYSLYADETRYDESVYGSPLKPITAYTVESYSIGVFFEHLILDYSNLRLLSDSIETVSVVTASGLIKKFILVAAYRSENSDRPVYNSSLGTLANQQVKTALFGGLQYHLTKSLMIGAFYNYYLLQEISIGATVFL